MFQDTYMRRAVALVGGAATIALLAYTYLAYTQARNVVETPAIISVSGKGEVFAAPDIATFSFAVNAREKDAATAKDRSAQSVNAIVAYLKDKGVEERDIKTDYYNLMPRYEYEVRTDCPQYGYCPPGKEKLVGYEATQSISVKVRNTDDVGMLISGVAELGATNMSGISFTIDDEETLRDEARDKAIADAQEKAEVLAGSLGVRLVRMTGYYENNESVSPYYGKGGAEAMMLDTAAATPDIPVGENTITSQVTISYEVR